MEARFTGYKKHPSVQERLLRVFYHTFGIIDLPLADYPEGVQSGERRMLPRFLQAALYNIVMPDYLQMLIEHGKLLGTFDPAKVSDLSPQWFWDRRVSLIDFRGDLQIRCRESITFGFNVSVYTASHSFQNGGIGRMTIKRCWIERGVFVGSGSILYNCHLMEHSIVSIGSVVRNITVPPYTVVEGNPAVPIARYEDGKWRKFS